ncbi:MAG: InlB B-repeat-containing protein [Actinobacteria bacterium]|nr:InlB B-repeat-containing protein [Actinomycetota bacterium]
MGTNNFSCYSSGGNGARASGVSQPGNENGGLSGGGGGGGAYKGYDPFTSSDFGSEAAARGARGGAYIAFQRPWKVAYTANSADSGTAPSAAPAAPGSSFTVAANSGALIRTGYTFGGWNTAADGSGTTYAAGSGSFSASANVELFAKWNSATVPSPPSGNAGDGGGATTPEPSASATATPTPTPTASAAANAPALLDPIATSQNPNIPAGGVPAGGLVFLVNGQSVPLTVSPNVQSNPVALMFSAPGLNMRLEGRGDDSDPLGLTSKQALILQSEPTGARSGSMGIAARSGAMASKRVQPVAQTSGDGFAPSTPVKLFLLPGTSLGEVTTDSTGAFAGSVPIPAGVAPGVHTLQANGFAPDLSVRSLSIGVLVKPTAIAVKANRATAKVYFESLSSVLTDEGMSTLKALVKKTGKKGVRTMSIGYVQGTTITANDEALSTQRAKNVAAYLKKLGLKGRFVVRGDGVAKESGALARRVNVTVTYQR